MRTLRVPPPEGGSLLAADSLPPYHRYDALTGTSLETAAMSARLLLASSCPLFLVALCFGPCPGDEPAAEAGRAAAPALPAPRPFTLQAPKVPLSKALAELERQFPPPTPLDDEDLDDSA